MAKTIIKRNECPENKGHFITIGHAGYVCKVCGKEFTAEEIKKIIQEEG